jgi:hypothetical protein
VRMTIPNSWDVVSVILVVGTTAPVQTVTCAQRPSNLIHTRISHLRIATTLKALTTGTRVPLPLHHF